jgi:hypothetical protein
MQGVKTERQIDGRRKEGSARAQREIHDDLRYSIYFFVMDAADFAAQLVERRLLLDRMVERIRSELECSEREIEESLELAERLCLGKLPDDCEPEYFSALCWLAEAGSEKVQIPPFVLFRSLSFLDDIGIWPFLRKSRPSFAMPVCSDPPPEVGFLPSGDASNMLAELQELPECDDSEATDARQEFLEVLETIVDDRLDLLAVLLES